jgi:hypothetical protein
MNAWWHARKRRKREERETRMWAGRKKGERQGWIRGRDREEEGGETGVKKGERRDEEGRETKMVEAEGRKDCSDSNDEREGNKKRWEKDTQQSITMTRQ